MNHSIMEKHCFSENLQLFSLYDSFYLHMPQFESSQW